MSENVTPEIKGWKSDLKGLGIKTSRLEPPGTGTWWFQPLSRYSKFLEHFSNHPFQKSWKTHLDRVHAKETYSPKTVVNNGDLPW